MATYVCSDIHGQFDAWVRGIINSNIRIGKHDSFVILGDLIDRGPDSLACVSFALKLLERYPEHVTYLMGNHERMMLDFLCASPNEYMQILVTGTHWLQNGGIATAKSFLKNSDVDPLHLYRLHAFMNDKYGDLIQQLSSLPYYKVDERHKCVYVHAGFESDTPLVEQKEENMIWIRDEFLNGFQAIKGDTLDGKLIVHGHTPIQYMERYTGVRYEGEGFYKGQYHLNLDGGAALNQKVLIVRMDDFSYVEEKINQ